MDVKIYVFKTIAIHVAEEEHAERKENYEARIEIEDNADPTVKPKSCFGASAISTIAQVIETDYRKENLFINFRPQYDFESEARYTPRRCLHFSEQEIQKFTEAFRLSRKDRTRE